MKEAVDILRDKTILFVEDEDMNINEISKPLKKIVKTLMIARDGSEGLETFKNNQNDIDLIITDINMPNMNGVEMVKNIRLLSDEVKIIVATGHTEEDKTVPLANSNISGFLVKPYRIQNLIQKIAISLKSKEKSDNIISQNKKLKEIVNIFDKKTKKKNISLKKLNKQLSSISTILSELTEAFVINSENKITMSTMNLHNVLKLKKDIFELNDITTSATLLRLILKATKNKSNAKGLVEYTSINKSLITIVVPYFEKLEKINKYTIYIAC